MKNGMETKNIAHVPPRVKVLLCKGENRAHKDVLDCIPLKNKRMSSEHKNLSGKENSKMNTFDATGTRIYKQFNNKYWQGKIISHVARTGHYKVVYTNDNEEELSADEIHHCLKPPKQESVTRF